MGAKMSCARLDEHKINEELFSSSVKLSTSRGMFPCPVYTTESCPVSREMQEKMRYGPVRIHAVLVIRAFVMVCFHFI